MKYLLLSLLIIGCTEKIGNMTETKIRSDCRIIGHATDNVRFTLLGYKCADSLEYWIPEKYKEIPK